MNEPNSIIRTERLAEKMFGSENPIGQRMSLRGKQFEIIGIIKDFHYQHPTNDIHPFLSVNSGVIRHMVIKTNSNARELDRKK